MQVPKLHVRNEIIKSCIFLSTVKFIVAVPLIDHIVMFGIEPSGNLGVLPEFIHHDMVIPAPVHITSTSSITPNIPAFTVEHGNPGLFVTTDKVPFRTGIGVVDHIVEEIAPLVTRQVGVPGIEIGFHMIIVTGRIVFN